MNGSKPITLDDIERRLILDYSEKRYQWHKQLTSLCAGGLTLLISFQTSYVPENPDNLILLKICWASLTIAIISGVLALVGAAQTPLDIAVYLSRNRTKHGDSQVIQHLNETNGIAKRERIPYMIAERLLVATFLTALVSLAVFAILNAGFPQQFHTQG